MTPHEPPAVFPGFPALRANVTFVPIQFFTVVLPHSSRGCARVVGYALRRLLGWVDAGGEPTHSEARFTYRQLIEQAGVSRDAMAGALQEAVSRSFLECVEPPHPDRPGEPARSGVYRIRWDAQGAYTDRPEEFRGFYYPEAAVMTVHEAGTVVRRPKAARKNIPNAFFDRLLPRERLSVVRLVGALLFYSIQWGPGGERRVPVQLSVTELSRLTRFTRQHVYEALVEARRQGYVVALDPGRFDPSGSGRSEAATYAIRWAEATPAAGPGVAAEAVGTDRSEKENEAPVRKGERERSEKGDGNRSEKENDIRIKTEHKTDQTTAAGPERPRTPEPAAAAYALLLKTGFEPESARILAHKRGLEVIQRQIAWLPLRNSSRSRLGLLRRAIEFDWPKPEGSATPPESPELALAREFTSHYYAGYHGYSGPPTTEVLPRDAQTAARFLERLFALKPDRSQVAQWGRRFGEFMRQTHREDARARPNLAPALLLYGDAFLRTLPTNGAVRTRPDLEAVRAAHEREFAEGYRAYLRGMEARLQREEPALYAAFHEERRRTRHAMTGGMFLASADKVAWFDSEAGRLEGLAAFCEKRRVRSVLGFWDWDARVNPQRLGATAPAASSPAPAASP